MAAFLMNSVAQAAAGLLVISLVCWRCPPRRGAWILLAAGLILMDSIATGHTEVFSLIPNTEWNWQGKLAAIVLSLVMIGVLLRSGWSRLEFGLTLRQYPNSLRATLGVVALIVTLQTAISWYASERSPWDSEALAFQATMPTLAEELMVRGLLLGVLNRAFEPRRTVLGAACGWAVPLTALVFALSHGLGVSQLPSKADGQVLGWTVTFNAFAFGRTFVTGMVYAWLRERSGSLIMPMAMHTLINTGGMLARMIA